ncbi:hypothetical protein ABK040_014077 [Willaertia magna]
MLSSSQGKRSNDNSNGDEDVKKRKTIPDESEDQETAGYDEMDEDFLSEMNDFSNVDDKQIHKMLKDSMVDKDFYNDFDDDYDDEDI